MQTKPEYRNMSTIPSQNDRAEAAEKQVSSQGKSGKEYQEDVQRQVYINEVIRRRG
jgi:hypothetical protein